MDCALYLGRDGGGHQLTPPFLLLPHDSKLTQSQRAALSVATKAPRVRLSEYPGHSGRIPIVTGR